MNTYCPAPGIGPQSPADNDYKPGFFGGDDAKVILGLAQDAASLTGTDCRIGELAFEIFQDFTANGMGRTAIFSAILTIKDGTAKTGLIPNLMPP